jgi:RNA polymerase sigma-70 factor, ECF subfamily
MDLFSFDDDYVRRLREGDRETEAHFYAYFRDLLHAKLRRKLRSQDAIDDVRQEVFRRTFERLDQIEDARKLGGFVNTICTHVVQEYYRQSSRAVSLGDQPDIAEWNDPDLLLDSVRNSLRVRKVLAGLDKRERDILLAVFLEEGDRKQVCDRYNVDREYLRVLLHRAKKLFREAYLRRKSGRRSIFETFGGCLSLLL